MQPNDSYRLVVRRGPQPTQTYDLNKSTLSLGRDITNDIVINDPEVSRHHLRLTQNDDGNFTLEDLGSTNGTFVNGQRVTGSRMLNNGDMIGLGETVTLGYERVRAGSAVQPTPPPTAPPYQPPASPGYGQPPSALPGYGQQPPVSPGYGQPPPAAPYDPQQPPVYGGGYYQQPAGQDYGYSAPGYQQPGPYGQDYDPYAVREDEPRSAARWIGIGCLVLGIFCCCTSGVALVLIDTLNLWDRLPVVREIGNLLRPIADIFF